MGLPRYDIRTIGNLNGALVDILGVGGGEAAASADAAAQGLSLPVSAYTLFFNGTTWDRVRGSFNATLLASAVRAATQTLADQDSFNLRGAYVTLDITAVPGVDTVQLVIEGKDAASGKYFVLAQDVAQAAIGTRTILVLPGAGAAAGGVNVAASFALPRLWRARVVHSAATNFTYSLGVGYID